MCPFGRTYEPDHVTCRSCERQQGPCRAKPKKRPQEANVRTWHEGMTLITTQPLASLNAWNNKPRYHYLQQRKAWEKVLAGTVFLWGRAKSKRRLSVRRLVEGKNWLIKDRDNLIGGLKPLKDVLTRMGVFVDDSDEFLEFEISQGVDPKPRVEITVEDLDMDERREK